MRPRERPRKIESSSSLNVPFKTQQQPIVDQARIADTVLVNDQAVHERAEFQERMPVATIACESRRLGRQHGAGVAGTDRCQQTLEAVAELTTARSTEIIVDYDDFLPT